MLNNLKDQLIHDIKNLHNAESQLIRALPRMEEAASDHELKAVFKEHLGKTKVHLNRLDEVATQLGFDPIGGSCDAMQALIREGDEIIESPGVPIIKDAALIAAVQRIEHYEIAAYGAATCFARYLDLKDAAGVLETILKEEHEADEKLIKIATNGLLSAGLKKEAARK